MNKSLLTLTAMDLMSRNLVLIPQEMSLQCAARLLTRSHVSGAPVVDTTGRCVGVLSTTDFLRWVENGNKKQTPKESPCYSWQIFGEDASPTDNVGAYMTSDPVIVAAGVNIGVLSQMMMDAHIHRIIVVNEQEHPIGIVSTTDILAAVAREIHAREPHRKGTVSELPSSIPSYRETENRLP